MTTKSQHEKCNFKEQPMTAQLKINRAMPEAARHENRESVEIRLESKANLKIKISEQLKRLKGKRARQPEKKRKFYKKNALRRKKEKTENERKEGHDWKTGERIGEAKKPGPPVVCTYCEARQGGGSCPGYPLSAKMQTCRCGKRIHLNCNRDHNCGMREGRMKNRNQKRTERQNGKQKAPQLPPKRAAPAETKLTTFTALVGKHVPVRVRPMQLENKWMAVVDNDGLQGDAIRTGDQLHQIGITDMDEYLQSPAWMNTVKSKKNNLMKSFTAVKTKIHIMMADEDGAAEWKMSRRYEKIKDVTEFKEKVSQKYRLKRSNIRKQKAAQKEEERKRNSESNRERAATLAKKRKEMVDKQEAKDRVRDEGGISSDSDMGYECNIITEARLTAKGWNGEHIPKTLRADESGKDGELRVLAMNTDGRKNIDSVTNLAKRKGIHMLSLAENGATKKKAKGMEHTLTENFSKDAKISVSTGLNMLFEDRALGGCTQAIGKGWNERVSSTSEDPRGWGRFMTTKLQGKKGKKLWITQLYAAYDKNPGPQSYWAMIKERMADEEKNGEKMKKDKNRIICPKLQMIEDLDKLRNQAELAGAEIIIMGDFNEKWKEKGLFQEWATDRGRLANVLQGRSGTGGDCTCKSVKKNRTSWTDIDWVLCSAGLTGKGLIKTAVWHEPVGTFVHAPIFVTINTNKILGLQQGEVVQKMDFVFEQNLLGGKEGDPKVLHYKKQLKREWEKADIERMMNKASDSKPKDRCRLIQKAYDAQEKAVKTAMESVKRKYQTGKKTKTWYSKANVSIRKLRTESDTIQEIWKRKTAQNRENPREGGSQQANSNRSRKAPISAKKLKEKIQKWYDKLGEWQSDDGDSMLGDVRFLNRQRRVGNLETRTTKERGWKACVTDRIQAEKWNKCIAGMYQDNQNLDKRLEAAERKSDMLKQHANESKYMGRAKTVKQLMNYLADKPKKGGAMARVDIAVTNGGQRMRVGKSEIDKIIKKVKKWFEIDGSSNTAVQQWNERSADSSILKQQMNKMCKDILTGNVSDTKDYMTREDLEGRVTENVWNECEEPYLSSTDNRSKREKLPEIIRKASAMGLFKECEHGAGGIEECKKQEEKGEEADWASTLMEIVDNLIVVDDVITKPTVLAETMMEFCRNWYGEGREGRWNCNATGGIHPLAKLDERGERLMEHLMAGNYESNCEAGEELPPAVQKMYDKGLFNKKKIGRGSRKGQETTPEDFGILFREIGEVEWELSRKGAKKCTRPGKSGITKPAIRHMGSEQWNDVRKLLNMADNADYEMRQHRWAQLFLIRKDPNVASINRHRMLVFEDEILKRRDSVLEARVDRLLTDLGLLEEEQYGFTKAGDTSTAIYTVASAIEDARVRDKEIWIEFKDQEKAFDTLEAFQGKVMSCMVLGIPIRIAQKWLRFDKSLMVEIINAYGTTADQLGVHKGTFTPICGGLQGGPRSPGMWKRFYDILIKAQKLEHKGKIAEIEGEDGIIHLTSVVFADDTVNMGANNVNIQDRGKTAQEFSDYAGCHTNAGKSFLGALIKNIETGEYRKPTADENIYYKRLDSDLVEGCQLLGPLDRVRYLGWFTAMSNEVDESFKQMKEECDERLGKMASKRCTGGEFMQFVKIAEVPRMLHRMRHSNTGKDSIDKIQTMYNRTYRLKGRIVRTMPNEVMWTSKNRCGMEWVNFWDEISIDRTVAWMKHANSGGDVGKIAASAIKRSEEIAPSSTAVLEQTEKPIWDGTMLGRIVEWMTGDIGKDFSITGGSTNRGKREKDIAIADINRGHRWQAMVAAGCRLTGIHWISEILTSDDNTWINEVQPNGKFNNNGSFEWKHITYDTKTAERKTLRKRNKWSHWATHVKKLVKLAMEEIIENSERIEINNEEEEEEENCSALLGNYWKDSYSDLKPMDMVRVNGTEGVKMVIAKQKDAIDDNGQITTTVEVANMIDCTDMNHGADHEEVRRGAFNEFGDHDWDKSDRRNLGICNTVGTNGVVYTITDQKIETVKRGELTKVCGELMRKTILNRPLARLEGRRKETQVNETNEGGYGKRGSVFGRIWETQNQSSADMTDQESVVTGESEEEIITQFLPICGEGNDRKRKYRAETNQLRLTRMNERTEKWREKARLIGKNASILAGGDGSRISRNGETVAAYGWGVYGIGEHSVDYWKAKHNSEVHIMASGGNMDWAPEYARSNTRAEQTHILAAMIQLFQTGINVLYSVDYTGAIDNFNECEKWTQTEWLNCENKDVMEGIMFMKSKYKKAETLFECFHNRGHPETYIPEKKSKNYNALERVAVMSDEIADGVRDNCARWKETPYIPGRSRFKLMYKGEEVVKPMRKTMKKLAQIAHHEKYCNETRRGKLSKAADETHWGIVGQCNGGRKMNGGTPYDKSRQTYHWLMTKHALVKKGIIDNKPGSANCTCGKTETQWHTLSTCKVQGIPEMRKRYAKRRKTMMDKLKIPIAIQLCFIDNLEPDAEGCYPDWSSTSAGKFKYTFKHQTEKVVQQMMKHRGAAIHWFQNGHPMKTLVERHEEMMGTDEKTAMKFCTEWYKSKRQETSAIWKQRKLRNKDTHEFTISELQEQVEEIVKRKRKMIPPEKTLSNDEYRKLRREGLERLIETETNKSDQQSMLRWTMSGETESKQSRAKALEKMENAEAKRKNDRKLHIEKEKKEYSKQKTRTMRVDTMMAKLTEKQKA